MADGFYRLRHDTVICRNYQNCDICSICTTHTHSSKCFMTRRVQKCNLLSVDFYNRCTDVLCNTTSLTIRYMCLADSIQQRSFTMVNVSHYTYNRRSGNQCVFILFFLFQKLLDDVNLDLFLTEYVKLHRDLFCLLVIYFLIDGDNLAL